MAVVNNSLQLKDAMTPVLKNIVKALDSTLTAMASVDKVASREFEAARRAIGKAAEEVQNYQEIIRQPKTLPDPDPDGKTKSSLDELIQKAKNLAATYLSIQSIKAIVNLSDDYASLGASLDIINDHLQTTEQLQEKIRQSALRTGSNYFDVANNVKNLAMMAGNAFGSNDEMLYFTEQLNKQFAIAGVKGSQAASVMYNLTQALSSGVLRGNDFNILASNMGSFIDAIAKHMGVTRAEMKKMAEEGKITAAEIKGAMYAMADETNAKFAQMPRKWENIWNNIQTQLINGAAPLLNLVNQIFNSKKFQAILSSMTNGIITVLTVLTGLFQGLVNVASFVYDHWLLIEPVLWSIGFAIAANIIPKLWSMVAAAWAAVPPLLAQAAAWLAINWPILLVGAAIGAVIAILKHFGVTGQQVIGAIVGAAFWLGQVFKNVCTAIGTFFNNLWSGIQEGFWSLISTIVKGISWLLDKVNINGALDDQIAKLNEKSDSFGQKAQKAGGSYKSYNFGSLTDAYKKGNAIGMNFAAGVKNKFGGGQGIGFNNTSGDFWDPSLMQKVASATDGTNKNTKKLTEGINISDEDLELLKESARTQFVNRFTTMTPQITANFGDIHETADVNSIMQVIGQSVQNALESNLT